MTDVTTVLERFDVERLSLRGQAIAVTVGWMYAHERTVAEIARHYGKSRSTIHALLRELKVEIVASMREPDSLSESSAVATDRGADGVSR